MAESTDPSCSRYLKRKHDLSEADSIVENFLKSRKNDSSGDQNTHPSSCGSSEDSLKAHMPFAANIINDEDHFVAEVILIDLVDISLLISYGFTYSMLFLFRWMRAVLHSLKCHYQHRL